MRRDERVTDEMVEAAQGALASVRYGLTDKEMRAALSAALSIEQTQPEPDFWTSHNNFENLTMLGKGIASEKGDVVWDFATSEWVNADTPLYTHPPVSALVNAQADADVVERWQPIETAPENQAILIHIPGLDYYGNNCVYAAMLVNMGTGKRWMTFGHAIGRDLGPECWPDAWMDVPAASVVSLRYAEVGSATNTIGGDHGA